jgi:hypothetical protein
LIPKKCSSSTQKPALNSSKSSPLLVDDEEEGRVTKRYSPAGRSGHAGANRYQVIDFYYGRCQLVAADTVTRQEDDWSGPPVL